MIATVIKHFMYDIGIGLFFDNLYNNLALDAHKKPTMVGVYVQVYEVATDCLLTHGEIVAENGWSITVLDEDDGMTTTIPIAGSGLRIEYGEDSVSDEELVEWLNGKDK